MKISDRTNLTGTQRRKLSLTLLMLVFFGGVVAGTVTVCATDNLQALCRGMFTQNMFKTTEIRTIAEIFFRSLIPLAVILAIEFLSGLFAFGQVPAIACIVYRGISAGIAASLFYMTLGLKGFFAVLVMLFPFAAVSTVVLILGARESIKSSSMFMRFAMKKHMDSDSCPEIKIYAFKFLILLVFCLVLSTADCVITYFFTGILLKP